MVRRKNGFTLIELLVVIAIIAILASILFPVFAKAREQARAISCLSNMKQLGVGLQMYVQDNDECYPGAWRQYADASGDANCELMGGHAAVAGGQEAYCRQASIKAVLDPYIRNGGVWKCPSDTGCNPNFVAGKRYTSYHYRHYFLVGTASIYAQPLWTYTETNFEKPSQIFSFCEVWTWHMPEPGPANFKRDAKMNLTFIDGHAKSYPVDRSLRGIEATGYDYHWPKPLDYPWGNPGDLKTPAADVEQ